MGSAASHQVEYSVEVAGAPKCAGYTPMRRCTMFPNALVWNFETEPVKNCWELFQRGVATSADGPCLGTRELVADGKYGRFMWKTYRQVERLALEAGSGLFALDAVPLQSFKNRGSDFELRFLALFSRNREEWIICEQACNAYGIAIVPLYDTLGPQSTEFILVDTGLECVVASDSCTKIIIDVIKECKKNGNNKIRLRHIILLDDVKMKYEESAQEFGIDLHTWDEVLLKGREDLLPITDEMQPGLDSINTVCYTSGTTGDPKGVITTHRNVIAACVGALRGPLEDPRIKLNANDSMLSYLPLAHVYERFCENTFFCIGGKVGFFSGDTTKLLDDVQVLKPTIFCSVPRLFNRINDRIYGSLQSKSSLARTLFLHGMDTKLKKIRSTGNPQHALWDRLVFDKTKALLGGRVKCILSGSAPLSPVILDRMKALFCTNVVEGYGMTETVAASFITDPGDPRSGHVGGPCPDVEFCLFDVSDTMSEYSIEGPHPKGELCFRGPAITPGYFCNKKETDNLFGEDGWLHSGDIAALLPNGAVKIIDRKKNIFKLAQGEYVAPDKIEAVYAQCLLVAQCFVFGYSTENALVGIIVLDEDQAMRWSECNGKGYKSCKDMVNDADLIKTVEKEIQDIGKEQGLKGFECVKKITLEYKLFSVENELLTPTFKLRRHKAKEAYCKVIDQMYAELHKG